MPIEKIFDRINTEAEVAAGELLARAGEEGAAVRKEFAGRASRLDEELKAYAEKKAGEEEKHLIVSEQLELRKSILARKREILDSVYAEAKKKIGALSPEESREILKNMILGSAVSGKEEIVVAPSQVGIFDDGFMRELRDGFRGEGSFELSDDKGDFAWGVVLREGRRAVDLSLAVVFEQLREKIEPRIAATLFEG
ncbi:MAG: V-type ATP synthase subunit E [Bacteroidales bacterium]|nr:V-type ATP synthase subunit E [Candidatus Latescibacterota bacterium]